MVVAPWLLIVIGNRRTDYILTDWRCVTQRVKEGGPERKSTQWVGDTRVFAHVFLPLSRHEACITVAWVSLKVLLFLKYIGEYLSMSWGLRVCVCVCGEGRVEGGLMCDCRSPRQIMSPSVKFRRSCRSKWPDCICPPMPWLEAYCSPDHPWPSG